MKFLDKLKAWYASTATFRAQLKDWYYKGGNGSIIYLGAGLVSLRMGTIPFIAGAAIGIFAYININVILKMKK
jgi:hypothetical protein